MALDDDALFDDPILRQTRASIAKTPRRSRRRRRADRDLEAAAPEAAAGPCARAYKARWHVANALVGFTLGYAYFRLRFVEDYEKGF